MTRLNYSIAVFGLCLLAGCSQIQTPAFLRPSGDSPDSSGAPLDGTRPGEAGSTSLSPGVGGVMTAPPPASGARTQEDFDTTTPEQRAAATAAPEPAGERRLGETVASLGDPTQSGFWIKSPLVRTAGPGRLENPANGKTALVELIPLEGESTGGSQVSLAALRLLEAPITDLPTLVVYAN